MGALQNDPAYDCFYFIADWHALTSDYADTSAVAENTLQIMMDYLAAGLDPEKSVLFQQSVIPEHAELHLLLSMVTPLGWLERVPTYKEALENVKDKDLHNYGFLGYPVLQTADIVIYSNEGRAALRASRRRPGFACGDFARDCPAVRPFLMASKFTEIFQRKTCILVLLDSLSQEQ